jgi:hypothetical protein
MPTAGIRHAICMVRTRSFLQEPVPADPCAPHSRGRDHRSPAMTITLDSKNSPQCEIGHILRRQRFPCARGDSGRSRGYRHHEDNAGSSCCSWPIGARDEWRERVPVEGKRISIVSELRPAGVREPVMLFLEIEPQGAAQGNGQELTSQRGKTLDERGASAPLGLSRGHGARAAATQGSQPPPGAQRHPGGRRRQ